MKYQDTMKQAKSQKSYLGLIVVVSTLTILTFILIAAIVIFLFTSQLSGAEPVDASLLANTSPLTMIDVDRVDPALALASLGGVPEAEVIIEAIDKERPETALAALLFQPSLSDKESAGDFLLLAPAYMAIEHRDKAIFSYQMAGLVATLSPDIPDTVQADVFLQASEGLLKLNEPELAKFYLDQAFLVASKSPFLKAAHRRSMLERLQKNYIILGERELARKSLDLSANPPDLVLLTKETTTLPFYEGIPLPESVQEAETNRWIKAQELAARLVERGGNAPSSTVEALKEALIEEDQKKLPLYETELAKTTQLSKKIGITIAKIEWLSIKYRIAKRAYGLSIVPEWEAQAEQIRADLTKTYEMLFALYADFIVALPEASQIDKATEEKLRREILAGELGRYPNYPEEQRRKQLLDVTNQLMTNQPELNIFIGVNTVAAQEMYTLQATE
jgi:hypothetical protein